MSMPTIQVLRKSVGKIGYGTMMLTWTPTPPPEEESFAAMKAAADAGCTLWSCALFYGGFNNIKLINAFFEKYPEYRDRVVLNCKFGGDRNIGTPVADWDYWVDEIAESKRIMAGSGKEIEIYTLTRWDKDTPRDRTLSRLKRLVDEGHVRNLGASELTAKSLEQMTQKAQKPAAVEIEVSLWAYEQSTRDVIEWAGANRVPVMAYSPLGRGFLTRKYKSPEDVPKGAVQARMPRFQGQNFYHNLKLVDRLEEQAEKKGVPPGELALAWVQGLSPYVVPIPGSSHPDRVKSNAHSAQIKLTENDLKGINGILDQFTAQGNRYPDAALDFLML